MARDYKNAARKKHDSAPGPLRNLLPFITGLALGLLSTFIIYFSQQNDSWSPFQGKSEPTQVQPTTPDTPVTEQPAVNPASAASAETTLTAPRFDFYNILPNKELSISEWEAEAPVVELQGQAPEDVNSVYILQVGSFKQMKAADQVKAQIAIVGVTADLTASNDAVRLVQAGSVALGGKGGGGRPDMAQAGGPDGKNAEDALAAIEAAIGTGA